MWRLAKAMLLLNAASSSALDLLEENLERSVNDRNSNDVRSLFSTNGGGYTYNDFTANLFSQGDLGEPTLYEDRNGFMPELFRKGGKEDESLDSNEASTSSTEDPSPLETGTLSERTFTTKGAEKSTKGMKLPSKSIRGSVGIVESNNVESSGLPPLLPETANQVIASIPKGSQFGIQALSLDDFVTQYMAGKGSKSFKKPSKKSKAQNDEERCR